MYRQVRNGVVLCLLVAAALGTLYWGRFSAPDAPAPPQIDAGPAGFYLRDAVVLGTDDEGRVLYRIFAELAEERPDGRLVLNDVRVEYQPAEQVPWLVRASRAVALPDESTLRLEGGVTLKREAGEAQQKTVVETSSLRLEPRQHIASASDSVRVTVGDHSVEAAGLTLFLKDDRLELESGHGQFVP